MSRLPWGEALDVWTSRLVWFGVTRTLSTAVSASPGLVAYAQDGLLDRVSATSKPADSTRLISTDHWLTGERSAATYSVTVSEPMDMRRARLKGCSVQ